MLGAGGVGGVLVLGKIKSWIFLSENTWGPSATQLETPDIKHTMQTNKDKVQRIEIIWMILFFNSILLYFLFHGSINNHENYENDEEWVKVYDLCNAIW